MILLPMKVFVAVVAVFVVQNRIIPFSYNIFITYNVSDNELATREHKD